MTGSLSRSVVLVVEDDHRDADRIQRILAGFGVVPQVFARAFEAIAYLQKDGGKSDTTPPALVLLDWKLPGGGASVLEAVRKAHDVRTTAVVVLSGSSAPADVDAAKTGQANEFVVKPADLDEYHARITGICEKYLSIAKPRHRDWGESGGA